MCVCVTQIMRVDLCGISQLLQFLTIKWDIPADPFIEAHSELQHGEYIISQPLTAFFLVICVRFLPLLFLLFQAPLQCFLAYQLYQFKFKRKTLRIRLLIDSSHVFKPDWISWLVVCG